MDAMTWPHIIYLLSLVVTIVVMGYIAWFAQRRRGAVMGAGLFRWVALLVCIFAVFHGASMLSPTEAWARLWFNARFLCLASLPVLWLVFVLQYAGRARLVTGPRIILLFVIPAVTQVMIWTNGWHHLWTVRDAAFVAAGPFLFPEASVRVPGPWFWVYSLYTNVLSLAGLALLFAAAVRMKREYRGQAILLGAGTLVMLLGVLFPTFNLLPGMKLNPLPQGFALGSLIIAWGIFRHRLLSALPVFDRRKPVPPALATIFVALAFCIILIGILYYRQYAAQFRESVEQQLSSIADLKVDELARWRRERLGDGATLAGNVTFKALARRYWSDPGDGAARWQIYSWLLTLRDSYGYDSVMLVDPRGVVRMMTAGAGPMDHASMRRYLDEARRVGAPVLSDFHREAKGLPIHLSVIAPLHDGPGRGASLGFVVMLIDPGQYLYPMITRWPVPSRSAETLLVRREGDDVLFLNELRFYENSALNLRFPLSNTALPAAAVVLGKTGTFEGIDYRGKTVVAALRAVPGSPWFMVARMDMEEVYAPVRERFWVMAAAMTALIAGAAAGTVLLWRRQDERHLYERLAAAEALRESEEKFRDIFESSTVGKSLTAPDGRLLQVNRAFADMLGYSIEELREITFADITHPDDLAESRECMRSLLAGDRAAYRLVKRYLRKNGGIVWADVSTRLNHTPDGTPSYFMTSVIDITERKRAEEELSALSRRHEAILNAVPEIIMEVNIGRVYTWSNSHGREFFGDDVIGREAALYFVGEQDTYKRVQALFEGAESSIYIESLQRRRDGESRLLAWWCQSLRDTSGNVIGALSSARDITEQKRSERDLKRAHEILMYRNRISDVFLTARYEDMYVGVLDIMLEAMESEYGVFGYLDEEGGLVVPTMTRKVWDKCQVPEKTFTFPETIWGNSSWPRAIREKRIIFRNEISTLTPPGHVTIRRHVSVPIVHQDRTVGLIQVANKREDYTPDDIDLLESIGNYIAPVLDARLKAEGQERARRRAEEELRLMNESLEERVKERTAQLEAANRELEAFAYSVSHDLRAPLRSIDGFSQAVLEDYAERLDDQGKDYLNRLRSASQRMGRLIDDILRLSRISRSEMRISGIDLSGLAGAIMAGLADQEPERRVETVIQEGISAGGDRELVTIAMENLLGNAWKFTSKKKEARVEFGSLDSEGETVFFVRDNGAGFDMRYVDRLFTPFQRLHGKSEFEGAGIGLSLVQRIINRHGGRVWAESEPGRGASIFFTLE
ncbi:MAG: PAS domain S-box protein [Spirochaetes bacterium]|nr:PAS domain S-box protein [Spirochaetota bacterium]